MTLTEWLLIGIAIGLAVLLGVVVRALKWLHSSAAQLAALVRTASATTRVTSTAQVDRARVHLVLMDPKERAVEYVMVVDPAQRAQTVGHGSSTYGCVSGSVDDGYFVYRRT